MPNLIQLTLIDDIWNMWHDDCPLDELILDTESLNIPKLHSKYSRFLMDENRHLSKMRETHKVLERDKYEYYQGKMCQEDLEDRGWEPLQIKILRTDIPRYLHGDTDVVRHLIQISEQAEKVSLLKSILQEINHRGFRIKSAIDWKKFINGVN